MHFTEQEKAIFSGQQGTPGARMALVVVAEAARMLGADRLISIQSAHIDGCLYHGASGTLFCEKLVELGARTSVPSTTNVGALNLLKPDQSRLAGDARKMAYRLMLAHERLGCTPSWTCAPYQAGARPDVGAQVAWGESNAVAFCNTVLGARTNRYGDFLDIACAISGKAPFCGLHIDENRYASCVIDVSNLPLAWQEEAVFFPVLGALIGREVGSAVCAVTGVKVAADEDCLKALCAAAAATGAVGLMHLVGITPEAPTLEAALGHKPPDHTLVVSPEMLRDAFDGLTRSTSDQVDAIALGSPHFSIEECRAVWKLARHKPFKVPVYICIGRHTLETLQSDGLEDAMTDLGVRFVVDTCVVVTPILPDIQGVLMSNSAKFAHYAKGNTGYTPVFGSLRDCISSAQDGQLVRTGWPFR